MLVASLASGCSRNADPTTPIRPTRGYVLISIDTLRADHLGLYGYPRPTSPFLDALAERAVVFDHAIVQLPGTLPSHMCIFTGLYPAEHGVYPPNGVLAPDIPTVPERFRAAGFRTGGFTEGGYVSGRFGFARGFDTFEDAVAKRPNDFETTVARGVAFLAALPPEQRFFLFLHTYAVHDPYAPPEPYRTQFAGPPPPDAFAPTGPNFAHFNRGHGTLSPAMVEYYTGLYDAEIRYTDDVVRRFFAELARLGLAEQTTVVITADHGEEFLDHGKMVHEQVYHELLHVPLLVVHPDVVVRGRVDALVQSIDIAPTLFALAGVAAPARLSGTSLVPYLAGRREPLRGEAYAEAFASGDRALYRARGSALYQLVVRRPAMEAGAAWVSGSISFEWPGPSTAIAARSFQAARRLRIGIDESPLTEITLEPDHWTTLPLTGPMGAAPNRVVLAADGCASPASLGGSDDDRCLAFQLRGTPARQRELYEIRSDPGERRDLFRTHADVVTEIDQGLDGYDWQRGAPMTRDLDPALRERLRALGYGT